MNAVHTWHKLEIRRQTGQDMRVYKRERWKRGVFFLNEGPYAYLHNRDGILVVISLAHAHEESTFLSTPWNEGYEKWRGGGGGIGNGNQFVLPCCLESPLVSTRNRNITQAPTACPSKASTASSLDMRPQFQLIWMENETRWKGPDEVCVKRWANREVQAGARCITKNMYTPLSPPIRPVSPHLRKRGQNENVLGKEGDSVKNNALFKSQGCRPVFSLPKDNKESQLCKHTPPQKKKKKKKKKQERKKGNKGSSPHLQHHLRVRGSLCLKMAEKGIQVKII